MARLNIDADRVAQFCKENAIREFALFGSVTRNDFGPRSDIDVLVEFEAEAQIGLLALARLSKELSALFGRKVDLVTVNSLSPYLRDRVLATKEVIYGRA